MEENTPWEDLEISEEQYTQIWKSVKHAEVDADDLASLCKLVFPDSKENQAKAYALHMVASEWEDCYEECECGEDDCECDCQEDDTEE